jgi:GNAT superfamily N-acetyltransferase
MPLPLRIGHLGMRSVTMPDLTQTLGVLFCPSKRGTYQGRLSEEIEATSLLIKALPEVRYFSVGFNYNFKNWTPFYWEGFQQTTGYTYVLHDISDIDKVVSAFDHSKRKNLKRAASLVEVREDIAPSDFYAHHQMTLGKEGKKIRYSHEFFTGLLDAAQAHKAGKTFFAIDAQGHIHAAIFILYDQRSAHYLASSIDPEFRSSGAATLLIKHAIEFAGRVSAKFDFEGSMMRGVETSFRRFGGELVPYYRIWKDRRSGLARSLGNLWRSIRS